MEDMHIEENNGNEIIPDAASAQVQFESPQKNSDKRKFILVGIGLLLVSCIYLSATGVLNFGADFYAGGYSVEDVIVTDEFGPDEKPLSNESKVNFSPTSKINAAVFTSGIDATVGMLWYHEDSLLFELFERTRDNYIATYIEGESHRPLPSGEYRVEIHIGQDSPPVKTVHFTVEEVDLVVIPAQPTPEGHKDIEGATFLEVPFAFDEIWIINGEEWRINEAKIVFLSDAELFVVVVETDLDPSTLSEEELEDFTRPVAKYAVDNGYWDQARQIQVNDETYKLDEPLAITLINPDDPGQGNRARFEIEELLKSE